MRVSTIGAGLTGLLLLTALSAGCAKEHTDAAAQAATRAEQAASRAEDAARRAEAAAGRVETAAHRAEAALERAEQHGRKPVHKKHATKKPVNK
ncbi:MAG TPA: hypothetical protein VKW76_05290 [Candidatus Binatia bacterium]|nr:hypothetical protein [Candidatus Binatia bacterium]